VCEVCMHVCVRVCSFGLCGAARAGAPVTEGLQVCVKCVCMCVYVCVLSSFVVQHVLAHLWQRGYRCV